MQSSMVKAIVEDFGNGGTIDGDLTISGDITVSGGGTLSFDEIIEGTQVIDVSNAEAFLVRKNSDGGDVFTIDTTNSIIKAGVDDTGVDVRFYSATASEGLLYDASEDELGLLLTTKLKFHDIGGGEEIYASSNGHLEINAGTTLDITAPTVDINASSAVTIDGKVQLTATHATNQGTALHLKSTGGHNWYLHPNGTTGNLELNYNDVVETIFDASGAVTFAGNITMADDTSIGIADDAERIEFDGAGDISVLGANFGIGTASPTAPLHLSQTVSTLNPHLILHNTGGTYGIGINFTTDATSDAATRNWAIAPNILSWGDFTFRQSNARGGDPLGAGTDRLYIDPVGNIGIGDTNPSEAKLSITGVLSGDVGIKVEQDQDQYGISIDQDGNQSALFIDADNTDTHTIRVADPKNTTGDVLAIYQADALTTGSIASFVSDSSSTATRSLVEITNDHASATGTTGLYIKQDSTGPALVTTGAVGIGVSPSSALYVASSDGYVINERFTGADTAAPGFVLRKSRGSSAGSFTTVANGDSVGDIYFAAADGNSWHNTAHIGCVVDDGSVSDGAIGGELKFRTSSTSGTMTEHMRIDNAGNIGIGTQSPAYPLVVDGGSSDGIIWLEGGNTVASMYFENSSTGSTWQIGKSSDMGTADDFGFRVEGSVKMVVTDGGLVGIGVSDPDQPIELKFDAGNRTTGLNLNNSNSGGYGPAIYFTTNGDVQSAKIYSEPNDSNNSEIQWHNRSGGTLAARMTLKQGNLGIGDTDPSEAKLSITGVAAGDYGLKIDNDQNTSSIYIDADGITNNPVINIDSPTVTTSAVLAVEGCDSLTSGAIAVFESDASNTTTRNLVKITNNHASATGTTGLYIQQDSTGPALVTTGNVGIGTSSPGDYHADADNLVVYGSGNAGITIAAGTSSDSAIYMADGTSGDAEYRGYINYDHNTDSLAFATSATERLKLDANSRISLSNNDSGTSNTIFGKSAGASLDAGSNYNVFIGEAVSDASMNDATYNVGVGYAALGALTTGDSNTAIGNQSMNTLTTGDNNTALGYNALYTDDTGNESTAIGRLCMYNQASDADEDTGNTGVGSSAGYYNVTGTNNTYVGRLAGYGASGYSNSSNTAIGKSALAAIRTGSGNTAVGETAGDTIATGTNNTLIGYSADTTGGDSINQIALGSGTTAVADNSVTLGNASVTAVYAAQDSGATVYCSGVNFPDTQAASGDANTLDDYEEGTWTPSFVIETGSNFSYDTQSGFYTKIGNVVHAWCHVQIDKTAGTNNISMTMPFVAANDSRNKAFPVLMSNYALSDGMTLGMLYANDNRVYLGHLPENGALDEGNNGANLANTTNITIDINITYRV